MGCRRGGRASRAHPRSRGEHWLAAEGGSVTMGSSPLARGTQGHAICALLLLGLIPARAGNTDCWSSTLWWRGAHPRPCGEHLIAAPLLCFSLGSSPPVRGAHCAHHRSAGSAGLIPARAGNTRLSPVTLQPDGAHPRSRGEHTGGALLRGKLLGSSPLARGTQGKRADPDYAVGLIPARAGNTT